MDKLRYNMDKWDEFEITDFYPDLCNIGEWAEDIREEWKENHPEYIPEEIEKFYSEDDWSKVSATPTPLSVAYKLLIEGAASVEIRSSLSKFVDNMAALQKEIAEYQKDQLGKLYGVPNELQTKKAIDLLDLCVKADLLDDHYQPTSDTKPFQLKLIAEYIGNNLQLYPLYSVFDQLWKKSHGWVKSIVIPASKNEQKQKVSNLFPNTVLNDGIVCSEHFRTTKTDEELKTIFTRLTEQRFISNTNTINDWMALFTESSSTIKPIVWNGGVRKIAYFNYLAFGNDNDKIWELVRKYYVLASGRELSTDSLKSQNSWINNRYDHDLNGYIGYGGGLWEIANYKAKRKE